MKLRRISVSTTMVAAFAIAAGLALTALPASAQAAEVPQATSANWAGYVVGETTSQQRFSTVSGSWVEPSADCSAGDGYAAFWVGLGGAGGQSQSLEQIGTQSDCVAGGSTEYYAWYELVPAAPTRLALAISPGDHISAHVAVAGDEVTVSLSDTTTGQSTTKTLQMNNPDTSSAEWIAESPSSSQSITLTCHPGGPAHGTARQRPRRRRAPASPGPGRRLRPRPARPWPFRSPTGHRRCRPP